MATTGLTVKSLEVELLANVSEEDILEDFCICDYECEYVEEVFASLSDTADYKNDSSSFLLQKVIPADTITFELFKAGVLVATIVDDTYGIYYTSFANQPLYTGFIVDWNKVLTLLGAGLYQIKIQKTILGVSSTVESRYFRLLPYNDIDADGTVKIKSIQTGNIIGSNIDYTDLLTEGWSNSYRIEGFFGNKTAVLEVDNYLNSDYELKQIQDKVRVEFTLFTKLLPSVISNMLAFDSILANEIFITDYNVLNHEIYREVSLYPVSFDEVTHYPGNTKIKYSITFTAKKDNIIKRNF